MRKLFQKKAISDDLSSCSADPPVSVESNTEAEQPKTAPPTLELQGRIGTEESSHFHMEFQMTIQSKIENLSSKQASMLIKILTIEAILKGVDISLYLSLEYLFSRLVGSKNHPLEMQNEKDRQAAMLANLILQHIRGEWFSLDSREQISEETKDYLISSGWLPDKRTYNSWKTYWNPRKFLQVRIVPLDTFLRKKEGFYVPYSSYTKGYGESSSRSRQRTLPSAELDGSDDLEDKVLELQLLDPNFQAYQNIMLAIELEKVKRIQGRK